jgi:putative Ca2+/H+ antiporter (TMEM165/GDT1 family)
MIIVSEIGDKTFLVAALMAMRHDRMVVFSAAFSALFVMTFLSAILGHAVPTLLPKRLTNLAAAVLFLFFGAKLMHEGLAMSKEEGVGEEMKEVEMELEEKELSMRHSNRRLSNSQYLMESGRAGRRARSSSSALPAPARSPSRSPSPPLSPQGAPVAKMLSGLNNLCSLLLSPAWVQTFVMTFLGEWGDRSQIATIAMAAGQDYWWVTAGAVFGHSICTAGAVIGGRAIAGKISVRLGKLYFSCLIGVMPANSCFSHSWRCNCFLSFRHRILCRIFIFSVEQHFHLA